MTYLQILQSHFGETLPFNEWQLDLIQKAMLQAAQQARDIAEHGRELTHHPDDRIKVITHGNYRKLLNEIDNANAQHLHALSLLKEMCDAWDATRLAPLIAPMTAARAALKSTPPPPDPASQDEW